MTKGDSRHRGGGASVRPADQATVWVYQITVKAHLDRSHWTHWFAGMRIRAIGDGTTILSGCVADQAALHGLLAKIRDLGLPLIALQRVDAGLDAEGH